MTDWLPDTVLPDTVLLGYYGRGNFGDDILLLVAYHLAREMAPANTIGVRCPPECDRNVDAWLPERLSKVRFGQRTLHRLIVHGGGGTYFDFARYGWSAQLMEGLIRRVGFRAFAAIEQWLRRVIRRSRLRASRRVGLGIGVGRFSAGSPKLRSAVPDLLDFDALWVRDDASVDNIEALGLSLPVIKGSDLAFLVEHWLPARLPRGRAGLSGRERPRVGLIVRDWNLPDGGSFAATMRERVDAIAPRYEVTLIVFDADADRETLAAFKDLPVVRWNTDRSALPSFVGELARQDVLITARAHGAICGACVGRGSVLMHIEPKMETVHRMLPDCTRLVSPQSGPDRLERALVEVLGIDPSTIAANVADNRSAARQAFQAVKQTLHART